MTARVIEVAIGLVRDARGRVLLMRRALDGHLPGLWEFPGGKLHAGESPAAALARELAEETGLTAHAQRPWLRLAHDYPATPAHAARRVVLHARVVTRWSGRAQGLQGQALCWAAPGEIDAARMPAANRPLVTSLHLPALYQISGPCLPGGQDDFLARIRAGLKAGVSLVCLRCPALGDAEYTALARAAVALATDRAQVLVHDRPHLVQVVGAHGVHLSARAARALGRRPAGRWCAVSCHSPEELAMARLLGADFAVLGPVRPTASHPGAPVLGWAGFAARCAAAGLPVYALGGMRPVDAARARRHGGQGVAALGALWGAGAPPRPV